MNYQKIYNNIIERAKIRNLNCYKERHHIIPKCLGGNNTKENIVKLTAKEHFICHRLLCLIHPTNPRLAFALWMMNTKSNNQQRYKISARIYEKLKVEYVSFLKGRKNPKAGNRTFRTKKQREEQSLKMKGKKLSEIHRKKLSQAHKGKKFTEEHKKHMSEVKKGKPSWKKGGHISEETKQKIREARLKQIISEETKQKISEKAKGRKCSEETKRKISLIHKGKMVSPETRKKISETLRKNHLNSLTNCISDD